MSEEKEDLIKLERWIRSMGLLKEANLLRKLLNLIEKQQKEIEKLENKYSDEEIRNTVLKRYNEVIENDYISKDKIKEKIKELTYKQQTLHIEASKDCCPLTRFENNIDEVVKIIYCKSILKELLGED